MTGLIGVTAGSTAVGSGPRRRRALAPVLAELSLDAGWCVSGAGGTDFRRAPAELTAPPLSMDGWVSLGRHWWWLPMWRLLDAVAVASFDEPVGPGLG